MKKCIIMSHIIFEYISKSDIEDIVIEIGEEFTEIIKINDLIFNNFSLKENDNYF